MEGVSSGSITLPCIALVQSDSFFHFVVVYKVKNNKVKYADPADGMHMVSFLKFKEKYRDGIITINKTEEFVKIETRTETVASLARQISNSKSLYIRLMICSVFIIVLGLLGSVLIELMISSAFEHIHEGFASEIGVVELIIHNPRNILVMLVIIYGLRLSVDILKSFTITHIACEVGKNMTTQYFDQMIKIPLNRFGRKRAGEYISRFDDVRKLNNLFADVVTVGILNITLAIGFGVALLLINYKLFIVTILIVMVFCVFTLIFQRIIKRMNYTVLQNNSKMVSIVEER